MLFSTLILKPLAYFGLPVYILHRLSQTSPLIRYYIRNILFICSLSFSSTVGFCSALPLTLLGRRYDVNYVGSRAFYAAFSTLSGLRAVVEGEEHLKSRPCVLVGNHQSMVDLLYLGCIFPRGTRIMSKQSLKYVPILGQFMQAGGAVFIDRSNNAVAVRSLKTAGEDLKRCHTSIWVFPEGTRTSRPYHDIRPFKKGAFHLAIQAGLPIVPVVAENYWNLYHQGHSESGTVKVRVLPPVPTEGLTADDVGDLAARVREQMLQVLREISDPNAPPPPAIPAESISMSRTEKDTPVEAPSILKESTPVPSTSTGDTTVSHPRDVSEERPETPYSEITSEGSIRRSENDTEEEEGMVLVGRPR